MKRIVPLAIILLSLLAIIAGDTSDRRGNVFSTTTQEFNDKPLVRVVAHNEKYCFGNCGAIYVFQSYRNGEWREITSFRHDDPVNFSGKSVRVVNDSIFYFSFGWIYAVTTDGGKTWSIWDAEKNLPGWKCCNYRLIENVEIEESGAGKMKLNAIKEGDASFLYTEDFGKTWRR